jgi:hypothetical protein
MLNIAPQKLLLTMLFTMAMSFIALAASFAEMPPQTDAVEISNGQFQ